MQLSRLGRFLLLVVNLASFQVLQGLPHVHDLCGSRPALKAPRGADRAANPCLLCTLTPSVSAEASTPIVAVKNSGVQALPRVSRGWRPQPPKNRPTGRSPPPSLLA